MPVYHLTNEQSDRIKRDLMRLMGQIGIDGVMELLTEIGDDFGEGIVAGDRIQPDPKWMAIAAQLEIAKTAIKEICKGN